MSSDFQGLVVKSADQAEPADADEITVHEIGQELNPSRLPTTRCEVRGAAVHQPINGFK
jgi:hypothetical protein